MGNQLREQLVEVGFVEHMKKKHIPPPVTPTCNMCGASIIFKRTKDGDSNKLPYESDGERLHWETCPFNTLAQKRNAYSILKKLIIYMSVKHGDRFEDAGLSPYDIKMVTAILDKELHPRKSKRRKKKKGNDKDKLNELTIDVIASEGAKEVQTIGDKELIEVIDKTLDGIKRETSEKEVEDGVAKKLPTQEELETEFKHKKEAASEPCAANA